MHSPKAENSGDNVISSVPLDENERRG